MDLKNSFVLSKKSLFEFLLQYYSYYPFFQVFFSGMVKWNVKKDEWAGSHLERVICAKLQMKSSENCKWRGSELRSWVA